MHVLLALSLLAIPGLMGLCLLMEWLEQTFAGRYAGDDIRRVLDEELPPEHVEALVAQAAQVLLPSRDA